MSAAVLIVVVIIGVIVVGLALLYLCRRWRRPRDRSKYLSWDDARGGGALLQHQDSVVSVTPPDPNMNTFITYRNTYHNFELQYPDTWHCKESSTPQESLVAHFSCPDTEPTFKRLSVVRAPRTATRSGARDRSHGALPNRARPGRRPGTTSAGPASHPSSSPSTCVWGRAQGARATPGAVARLHCASAPRCSRAAGRRG